MKPTTAFKDKTLMITGGKGPVEALKATLSERERCLFTACNV